MLRPLRRIKNICELTNMFVFNISLIANKFALEQAMKAQGGSRGVVLFFL